MIKDHDMSNEWSIIWILMKKDEEKKSEKILKITQIFSDSDFLESLFKYKKCWLIHKNK